MYEDFDDTLPLPEEVEQEFREKAGDNLTALAWLSDHGVDSTRQDVALIQYGIVWNPETGRYRFLIYEPDHVGPKYPPELAIPIVEDGTFVDLLFISDEMTFARATCRARWLGREYLSRDSAAAANQSLETNDNSEADDKSLALPVLRLHAHPMDWLEAGCTGVCHIEPISRKALKDLRAATRIECNDIQTALDAWDWGFGADDDELKRFEVDDSPFAIRSYFEHEFKWRTSRMVLNS